MQVAPEISEAQQENSQEQQQQPQNNEQNQGLVLVTGATGYLAGHVINILLRQGFKVRGTVRSVKNEEKNKSIYDIFPERNNQLELVEANLLDNECWEGIMQGCDYVIHTASPFPSTPPKHENDIIKPAVDGTKAVMQAAIKMKVKKIVITSSIASIFTGHKKQNFFSENDWSNLDNSPAYEKSKHLAEKVAWDIYKQNPGAIKLTTICPGYIQGPNFHKSAFTSGDFVIRVMKNELAGIPKISLGIVDVRDAALAHVKAILPENIEKTDGQRYILNEGSYWMEDLINILRDEFKQYGYKIPSMTVGKTFFTMYACCDKQAGLLKPFYGRLIMFDNSQSRNVLQIQYNDIHKTMIDFAYDLIKQGIIPDKINKTKKSKK